MSIWSYRLISFSLVLMLEINIHIYYCPHFILQTAVKWTGLIILKIDRWKYMCIIGTLEFDASAKNLPIYLSYTFLFISKHYRVLTTFSDSSSQGTYVYRFKDCTSICSIWANKFDRLTINLLCFNITKGYLLDEKLFNHYNKFISWLYMNRLCYY